MIKILWFVPRPERDLAESEAYYQNQHVTVGMRQENLQGFRINRGLYPQPQVIAKLNGSPLPPVFRLPEGYWETWEAIQECYRSPNGMAALADGMLNARPILPDQPRSVLFLSEEEMSGSQQPYFDIFNGRYVDPRPVKLFVIVRAKPGRSEEFDSAYADVWPLLARSSELGRHVVSRGLDQTLHLGKSTQWPPVGAEAFERVLEYYFRSEADLNAFLLTDGFNQLVAMLNDVAESTLYVATEPQEVFFFSRGAQPLSAGWQSLDQQ
jgi:hypothetical protein